MIVTAVTKDYGLLATDSALYDTAQSKMQYGYLKLFYSSRFLLSYMGTPTYFSKLDRTKLDTDVPSLVLYMTDYLKGMKADVEKVTENKSEFCMFALGIHKKLPTVVKFSSTLNFEPKYINGGHSLKFAFGDGSSVEYLEKRVRKLEKKGVEINPGTLAEILTRGLYNKMEEQVDKTIGGAVNIGCMLSTGLMIPLSSIIPA